MKSIRPIGLMTVMASAAVFGISSSFADTFTWQGKLVDAGIDADGVYDFEFSLWDDAAAGVQVGSTLVIDDVSITGGLLTADLDFGPTAFDGDPRWLQVALKADADGGFTTVNPRQPVHATPYAMSAMSLHAGGLGGVYADAVDFTNGSNSYVGDGSGLNDLNAGAISSGNLNAAIMPTGGLWPMSSDLYIGNDTLVIDPIANEIGIGTASPSSALHMVNGGPDISLKMKSGGSWTAELKQTNSSLLSLVNGGSERFTIDASGRVGVNTPPVLGTRFGILEGSSGGSVLRIEHNGPSGNAYGVRSDVSSPEGVGVYGEADSTSGQTKGVVGLSRSPDGFGVYGRNTSPSGNGYAGFFRSGGWNSIALHGEVDAIPDSPGTGIGVSGASNTTEGIGVYGQALDLGGANFGVYGISYSTDGVGVRGEVNVISGPSLGGWFSSGSQDGIGVQGACTNIFNGIGVKGLVNSANGYAGYFEGGRNYFEGSVGIGTESPNEMLHLKSTASTIIRLEADTDNSNESHQPRIEMSKDGGLITGGIGFYGTDNSLSLQTFDSNTGAPNIELLAEGSTIVGSGNANLGRFVVNQLSDTSSGGIGILNSTGVRSVRLWVDGADVARIDSTGNGSGPMALNVGGGNVGIGIGLPLYDLHVNGTAAKPGGGSWTAASDRRLKKNIRNLDNALDALMRLRGVSFEYKQPEAINELSGQRIGMIAQEVERVFPDWVEQRADGYKAVTVRGFEALAVEALRELRAEKDEQLAAKGREIAALQAEMNELRALVSELINSNPAVTSGAEQ